MKISNYQNQYIKLQSEKIQEVIDNIEDFTSIAITGNINCCKQDTYPSATMSLANPSWKADLNTPVLLGSDLTSLFLKNIITGISYNVLINPIALSYVESSCMSGTCNMETFSNHFIDEFKNAIDNWFDDQNITSNVTIVIEDNTVGISNLPSGFFVERVIYNTDRVVVFGYNNASSNIFLLNDGIYIHSKFFNKELLEDGVYDIAIKISKSQGYILEENCAFIDVKTSCMVAKSLNDLLKDFANNSSERTAEIIHVMHYSLTNGSNCGCNCIELCKIYNELYKLISDNYSQISDCGC